MAFSKKTLDFLFENCLHDSKAWYQEHKEDFKHDVFQPFSELVEALQPTMNGIDNQLMCDPKKISRIYRDARYSKGKSIFRDNLWYTFGRARDVYESLPAFYFGFSPRGFDYGCGYYSASTVAMGAIRTLILNNDIFFQKALEAYKNQDVFQIAGDFYKKNRYPDHSEKLYNWLNRKTIYLTCSSNDYNVLFSENLSEKLADDFKKIAPVYHFFLKAQELAEQIKRENSK